MYYVGVDLHKQSISLCVVELADRKRKIIERKRFHCDQELEMAEYFAQLESYQLVVEATASYEWFVQLVEPTADRVVLDSIPCVGPVTIDVVLAEVGDIRRFGSQRKATAYAGLAPGIRERM